MNEKSSKESQTIITHITQKTPNILIGLKFQQPSDMFELFSEHMYCLFLLLYSYGEKQHKSIALQKIRICKEQNQRSLFKSGLKISNNDCFDKNKLKQINKRKNHAFDYFQKQLLRKSNNYKNTKIHSHKQREYLRNAFMLVLQNQEGFSRKKDLNFLSIAKVISQLVGIVCELKGFYNFQTIQFFSKQFNKQNIRVYIEINKLTQEFVYIKQLKYVQNLTKKSQDQQNTNQFKNQLLFLLDGAEEGCGNQSFVNMLRMQTSTYFDNSQDEEMEEEEQNEEEEGLALSHAFVEKAVSLMKKKPQDVNINKNDEKIEENCDSEYEESKIMQKQPSSSEIQSQQYEQSQVMQKQSISSQQKSQKLSNELKIQSNLNINKPDNSYIQYQESFACDGISQKQENKLRDHSENDEKNNKYIKEGATTKTQESFCERFVIDDEEDEIQSFPVAAKEQKPKTQKREQPINSDLTNSEDPNKRKKTNSTNMLNKSERLEKTREKNDSANNKHSASKLQLDFLRPIIFPVANEFIQEKDSPTRSRTSIFKFLDTCVQNQQEKECQQILMGMIKNGKNSSLDSVVKSKMTVQEFFDALTNEFDEQFNIQLNSSICEEKQYQIEEDILKQLKQTQKSPILNIEQFFLNFKKQQKEEKNQKEQGNFLLDIIQATLQRERFLNVAKFLQKAQRKFAQNKLQKQQDLQQNSKNTPLDDNQYKNLFIQIIKVTLDQQRQKYVSRFLQKIHNKTQKMGHLFEHSNKNQNIEKDEQIIGQDTQKVKFEQQRKNKNTKETQSFNQLENKKQSQNYVIKITKEAEPKNMKRNFYKKRGQDLTKFPTQNKKINNKNKDAQARINEALDMKGSGITKKMQQFIVQNVRPNSLFDSYTFSEYSNSKSQSPHPISGSPNELKASNRSGWSELDNINISKTKHNRLVQVLASELIKTENLRTSTTKLSSLLQPLQHKTKAQQKYFRTS